jgi:hypothetical protein
MDALAIINGMPPVEDVRRLEALMLALPQIDLQTKHIVHGKVSARYGLIPEGCALTGALTNLDNICILIGDITVTTDDGPKRLTGFNVITANKGAKRAGIAHSDTWWVTVHYTELTEISEIEDEMTDESSLLLTRRDGIEYMPVCTIAQEY